MTGLLPSSVSLCYMSYCDFRVNLCSCLSQVKSTTTLDSMQPSCVMMCSIELFTIILFIVGFSSSQPVYDMWSPYSAQESYINECETQEDINALCQRCAKLTRSNVVYPMCCSGKEEARTWCERYMNYGLHERHLSRS